MAYTLCNNTGKILVSYADPENGPTDDPADEIGWEYCDCPVGQTLWLKDARMSDEAEIEFLKTLKVLCS